MAKERTELTAEEIEENFNRFESYVGKIEDDRKEPALALTSALAERLALCPASARVEYHNCFPGGLVDHSIRVLGNALKLKKTFEFDVSRSSLIICCLFHDLGKVGDVDSDYYVPQDSDWHRDKLGELYKVNQEIQYMTIPLRSIWLLQHFGVKLTTEELVAIMIHDGQYADENRPYRMKESSLSSIVHIADYVACKQEKGTL